jgi:hypothetical protein
MELRKFAPRRFRMPSKDEYRNSLPAHVGRYSISASNCGSTPDADPQPFLSRERKPSESPWLKAKMVSYFSFWSAYFEAIHELFPNEG